MNDVKKTLLLYKVADFQPSKIAKPTNNVEELLSAIYRTHDAYKTLLEIKKGFESSDKAYYSYRSLSDSCDKEFYIPAEPVSFVFTSYEDNHWKDCSIFYTSKYGVLDPSIVRDRFGGHFLCPEVTILKERRSLEDACKFADPVYALLNPDEVFVKIKISSGRLLGSGRIPDTYQTTITNAMGDLLEEGLSSLLRDLTEYVRRYLNKGRNAHVTGSWFKYREVPGTNGALYKDLEFNKIYFSGEVLDDLISDLPAEIESVEPCKKKIDRAKAYAQERELGFCAEKEQLCQLDLEDVESKEEMEM